MLKNFPRRKRQQKKTLWAKTGRWKDRDKIRDLMADGWCVRAVLDFQLHGRGAEGRAGRRGGGGTEHGLRAGGGG